MRMALSLVLVFVLATGVNPLWPAAYRPAEVEIRLQAPIVALSNRDVLDMLNIGLAAEVVVAKIKASASNFDTSPAALQELKAAGVPESVILAMVQAPVAGAANPTSSPGATRSEDVEVKVPDGIMVEVEMKASVSSEEVEEGSIVDFTVVQPVQINGITVIERGAPAKARVVEAKKRGHWGRSGKIGWAMQDVIAVDGNRIPLRFTKEAEGGGSSGKVAGAVIATSILFWPAAPIWGFKKGKAAIIPAGKRFEVFVHGESIVKGKAK